MCIRDRYYVFDTKDRISVYLGVMNVLLTIKRNIIMKIFTIIISSAMLIAQTAKVQIIHNSPYPTVDIYVNDSTALAGVSYRACTGLIDLPTNTTVGIAPAGGDVIASFPFELVENGTYVVTASGIVGDTNYPFNLLASGMDTSAIDENSFALKVLHGVTDAPAVDIYANGSLLVDSLVYSEYTGYIQVASANYTIDVTPHGSREVVGTLSLIHISEPTRPY